MQNPEEVIQVLVELREMGLWLAIDDFGTGYSSLSYLQRFPVDRLKIDQLFLRGNGCDEMQGFLYSPPLPFSELTRAAVEKKRRIIALAGISVWTL